MTDRPLAEDLWQTLRGQWRVMLAVLPGLALTMLHSTMLDLPRADVVAALDSDKYRVQWIVGSYILGSATGMAMTQFIGSRIGLRATSLLAMALFTVAGSACGALSEVVWFTPLRLVQGFGTGLLISTGMVMLWRAYPRRRALAMALYGMAIYVPALAGAPLGGLLTASLSWRLIFVLNLPLGVLLASLAWYLLPADRPAPASRSRMDWIGLLLLGSWIVPLNVVLDLGQYWGWFVSPILVSWLTGLLLAFAAFVAWGVWPARPLINLRVLALPHFSLGLGIKVLFSINLYVLVSLLSGYMIELRGYQWWQGSLVLLPGVATMVLGILVGIGVGKDGNRRLRMGVGLTLMFVATGLLAGVDVYTAKDWQAARVALWGFGAGLVAGPALLTTFEQVSDEEILRTAGIFNVCRSIPVFCASGLLATYLTQQTDVHFDYLRQTVQYNEPAVAEMLRNTERHLVQRGSPVHLASKQGHVALGRWTKVNARSNAVRDVFLLLALVPAGGLVLVFFVRVPRIRPQISSD
jgi:MFS transporter, DHA2 family, multidrug resistance protein